MSVSTWWLWLLGEATLKGTLACLVIFIALSFVRRPTATVKHFALLLGLTCFMLVAVVSLTLPNWGLLPASSSRVTASWIDQPVNGLEPLSIWETPTRITSSSPPRNATSTAPAPLHEPLKVASPLVPPARASWKKILVSLWVLGIAIVFSPVCLGITRLFWIVWHSRPFTCGPWLSMCCKSQALLRMNRSVSIRINRRCTVPMVWGFFHPTILLPTSSQEWSAQRREVVLLHELAHVKRWDCLTHLIARLICTAFWFHPLVWWMLHRMILERELACDDKVVSCGTRGSDYAEHLMHIGSTAGQPCLLGSAALAMVSISRFETRVAAILDPYRRRTTMTRSWAATMIVFAVVVTAPLSMLGARDPQSQPPPATTPSTVDTDTAKPDATKPTSRPRTYSYRSRSYDLRAEPMRIAPQTLDIPSPAPGRAVVFAPPIRWWSSHWSSPLNTQVVGMSMKQGHPIFTVRPPGKRKVWVKYFDVPIDAQRYPHFVMTYRAQHTDEKPSQYVIYLDDGSGPDYGGLLPVQHRDLIADGELHTVSVDLQPLKPIGDLIGLAVGVQADTSAHQATFELIDLRFEVPNGSDRLLSLDDQPITVQVVDSQGEPIAGATVTVDAERANWAQSATTDDTGRATVTPWQTKTKRHMIRVTQPGMMPVEVRDMPDQPGEIVVALEPAAVYGGIIVDTHGRPMEGIAVYIQSRRTIGSPGPVVWTREDAVVLTDAAGQWQAPPLPRRSGIGLKISRQVEGVEQGLNIHHVDMVALANQSATLVWQMPRPITVQGRIVNQKNEPIDRPVLVMTGGQININTATDTHGSFEITIPSADHSVLIAAKGYAPRNVAISPAPDEITDDRMSLTVALEPGRTLKGVVLDSSEQPVEGAMVNAYLGGSRLPEEARTDHRGNFVLTDTPNLPVTLVIRINGKHRISIQAAPQTERIHITLPDPPPEEQADPDDPRRPGYDPFKIFRRLS